MTDGQSYDIGIDDAFSGRKTTDATSFGPGPVADPGPPSDGAAAGRGVGDPARFPPIPRRGGPPIPPGAPPATSAPTLLPPPILPTVVVPPTPSAPAEPDRSDRDARADPGGLGGPARELPAAGGLRSDAAAASGPPVGQIPPVVLEAGQSDLPPGADQDLLRALAAVASFGGSDLHVSANAHPMIRRRGSLEPFGNAPWSREKVAAALLSLLEPDKRAVLEETRELDWSFALTASERFRANFYWQRGSIGRVPHHPGRDPAHRLARAPESR